MLNITMLSNLNIVFVVKSHTSPILAGAQFSASAVQYVV